MIHLLIVVACFMALAASLVEVGHRVHHHDPVRWHDGTVECRSCHEPLVVYVGKHRPMSVMA